AGGVVTDEPHDFPLVHLQGDVQQRLHRAEPHGDALQAEHWGAGQRRLCWRGRWRYRHRRARRIGQWSVRHCPSPPWAKRSVESRTWTRAPLATSSPCNGEASTSIGATWLGRMFSCTASAKGARKTLPASASSPPTQTACGLTAWHTPATTRPIVRPASASTRLQPGSPSTARLITSRRVSGPWLVCSEASSASAPTTVSRQPRRPHRQICPRGSTCPCPSSPAVPPSPRCSRPPRLTPAPVA